MKALIYLLSVLVVTALVCGCCDDCLNCPETEAHEEQLLLFSYANHDNKYFTYRLSSRTYQVLDSIGWLYEPPNEIAFSPDGRYVAFQETTTRTLALCTADFLDTIALSNVYGYGLSWSPRSDLISFGRDNGGLVVLAVPSLTEVMSDTLDCDHTRFSSSGELLYTNANSYLGIYDIDTRRLSALIPVHDNQGNKCNVFDVAETDRDSVTCP